MVEGATNFKKSGYSEEDSAALAKIAALYQNIADEQISAGDSADFIISQMKAFNIEATDSMGIVDRFNEIGNNFAIDSVGIGEALQRSASALAEAGNSIDESIALVTAANSVIQNPQQVGEMLADYKVA